MQGTQTELNDRLIFRINNDLKVRLKVEAAKRDMSLSAFLRHKLDEIVNEQSEGNNAK